MPGGGRRAGEVRANAVLPHRLNQAPCVAMRGADAIVAVAWAASRHLVPRLHMCIESLMAKNPVDLLLACRQSAVLYPTHLRFAWRRERRGKVG